MISKELIKFLKENETLINQNSKKSWEEIYNKVYDSTLRGKFTKMLLDADIDPAGILGYIPRDYLCESKIAFYKIPNNIISIGVSAFALCNSLTSIEIPDSVTSIGDWAFSYCRSLTSMEIPDSVTSIGYAAFEGCSNLTSVIIPDNVTSIGDGAFYKCSSLTSVVIPDSVTSIGFSTFRGCSSLTSVEIPDSVTGIGERVFAYCTSLKEIKFKGTKKQAIQSGIGNRLETGWREGSSIEKIICSDGVIEL